MSNIQPVLTRWKSTIWKGETYDVLSIQRENANGTKILGKSDTSKEKEKKKTQCLKKNLNASNSRLCELRIDYLIEDG